ncbi:unnamed protein product [Thlaspi arvense]|uniref:Uncharacterized protein n=1 Tax=Thlaspi arvense TaxID=13288 RepID=A0AAU9RBH6_THLAR|nr:unnamed protein product [Thlaspi arvense]
MVGRGAPREPTTNEMYLYLGSLKKGLQPSKYKKFVNIMQDITSRGTRVTTPNDIKRVEEILKDYPRLLLGFSVLVPDRDRPIHSAEASKGLRQFKTIQTMVGKRISPSPSPVPTMDDALIFLVSVEEAFQYEPANYDKFVKIMLSAQRLREASAIAKVEKLTRDHPNLLMGFSAFLSADSKIPRVTNKRKRAESDGAVFMNKPKTRSQSRRVT